MKVKQNEINFYWRKQNQRYNQRNRPDLQVRQVTKEFLTKKETMSAGEQNEGLENLLNRIREILTGDTKNE